MWFAAPARLFHTVIVMPDSHRLIIRLEGETQMLTPTRWADSFRAVTPAGKWGNGMEEGNETKRPLKTLDCAVVKHQNLQWLRSVSENHEQQAPVWTLSRFLTSYCNTMWFTKCALQISSCFSSVYFHFYVVLIENVFE